MWEFFLVLARHNVIVSNSCRVLMKPEPVNNVCSTVARQLYIIQRHVKQKVKHGKIALGLDIVTGSC